MQAARAGPPGPRFCPRLADGAQCASSVHGPARAQEQDGALRIGSAQLAGGG